MTQISLLSCLVICSTIWSSPLVTSVMREREGSSVLATVRLSILNPRPLKSPATRARTPNSFSTRIEIVWSMDTHGECKVSRRRQRTETIFSPPHYPHLARSIRREETCLMLRAAGGEIGSPSSDLSQQAFVSESV